VHIKDIESLHCDAGWRNFSFLKITTDEGITGYSEYNESYGSNGVSHVINKLSPVILGASALSHESVFARLYAMTRQAPGGINAQAIAAIENALLDIKGKALGVPCYELLGGKLRDSLPLYWSHCGTYRMNEVTAQFIGKPVLNRVEDLVELGAEVRESGFTALKCNMYRFGKANQVHSPGFARGNRVPGAPELNADLSLLKDLEQQMSALRRGASDSVDILLDMNFNFKTEGYLRVIRALKDFRLFWYELDIFNPEALAYIRRQTDETIASCESLYGHREFRRYFEAQSMDVAIIDVPWNGAWQSYKIAAMADSYETNVAPHNFYGHLCTMMSAHFCAAVPNFRIMEIDIDDVPWKDDLVTHPPEIQGGELIIPDRPGWGTDLNEEAIAAHPPKR
jgi:L-alanine-DL-glutamate epimerase-like enolase superfamily enzyme